MIFSVTANTITSFRKDLCSHYYLLSPLCNHHLKLTSWKHPTPYSHDHLKPLDVPSANPVKVLKLTPCMQPIPYSHHHLNPPDVSSANPVKDLTLHHACTQHPAIPTSKPHRLPPDNPAKYLKQTPYMHQHLTAIPTWNHLLYLLTLPLPTNTMHAPIPYIHLHLKPPCTSIGGNHFLSNRGNTATFVFSYESQKTVFEFMRAFQQVQWVHVGDNHPLISLSTYTHGGFPVPLTKVHLWLKKSANIQSRRQKTFSTFLLWQVLWDMKLWTFSLINQWPKTWLLV